MCEHFSDSTIGFEYLLICICRIRGMHIFFLGSCINPSGTRKIVRTLSATTFQFSCFCWVWLRAACRCHMQICVDQRTVHFGHDENRMARTNVQPHSQSFVTMRSLIPHTSTCKHASAQQLPSVCNTKLFRRCRRRRRSHHQQQQPEWIASAC